MRRDRDGRWVRRKGRPEPGQIDERRAHALIPKVVIAHELNLMKGTPTMHKVLFEDAASAWQEYLRTEKRAKPSTLSSHRTLLHAPGPRHKARIMRALGGKPLFAITTKDIQRFLSKLDREDISPRTVNTYRQVLHSIFQFACREDAFGLPSNPVAGTNKRPEDGEKPIDVFEPAEIGLIVRTARIGLHRGKGGYRHSAYSAETEREWQRINDQDAALFAIAAYTGLRMGELNALRWRDVDLRRGVVVVSRAMSAGEETSTKTRRSRVVPLARQAREEFERLRRRRRYVGRDDLVFCRPDGGPLDRSAVRTRFIRTLERAGLRRRRFHDLRHTFGSLAIRRFDLVAVKEMMGHSKLTTTERYLHSKPRPDDAGRLTAIFDGEDD